MFSTGTNSALITQAQLDHVWFPGAQLKMQIQDAFKNVRWIFCEK